MGFDARFVGRLSMFVFLSLGFITIPTAMFFIKAINIL